jgi:VanZ family protein
MFMRALCAFVVSVILVAGLWPFHSPENEVSWLGNGNGLRFGDYGSLLSAGVLRSSNSNNGVSLEIWLEPKTIDDSGTILSFYSPEHHSNTFMLRQSLDDLSLQRKNLGPKHVSRAARIYVDHTFHEAKWVFLTISSGEEGTSIYIDGALARMSREFRFSGKDLSGQLVIGNSSVTTDTWSGHLKGLAIYDRESAASQVTQNYRSWLGGAYPGVSLPESAIALYLFNERTGKTVHNQVDAATDLVIPERFFVLHEPFLERPWNEYYPGWNYWKDVAINIAGFIPLGFLFCAYFSLVRRVEHPTVVTVAFGFAVSLSIEVLQAFLPTRNSGTTDLITNTFGTFLGVMLCAWYVKHCWSASAGSSDSPSIERKDIQLVR